MIEAVKERLKAGMPETYARLRSIWTRTPYEPPPGRVRFGDLRRLQPVGRFWGRERGRPIDRYYIENFLERNQADVRGRALEILDSTYIRRYGGDRVERIDVMSIVQENPEVTIVADLTDADHLPGDQFDCIILTQTLQLIYDPPAAIRTMHRILRPGGVLLCTFPGITQTGDKDWRHLWYWSFTAGSAQRLFGEVFGDANVEIVSHGNVLVATAFLHGLAIHELTPEELDHHDPAFDVTITVRAVRR